MQDDRQRGRHRPPGPPHRADRAQRGGAPPPPHRNPATIAKAPRLEEEEVEPYTVEEVQRLLDGGQQAPEPGPLGHRPGARPASGRGPRSPVDGRRLRAAGRDRVHRGRLRPRYEHGCGNRCGRKPGFCPQKVNIRRETKDAKSRAGQRPIGVPERAGEAPAPAQARSRTASGALAGDLWTEKGYVFTSPTGEPLNPNTDYHGWKDLLKAAGVRDGRLHDARHTAATVLLILGVSDAVVDRDHGLGARQVRPDAPPLPAPDRPVLTDRRQDRPALAAARGAARRLSAARSTSKAVGPDASAFGPAWAGLPSDPASLAFAALLFCPSQSAYRPASLVRDDGT